MRRKWLAAGRRGCRSRCSRRRTATSATRCSRYLRELTADGTRRPRRPAGAHRPRLAAAAAQPARALREAAAARRAERDPRLRPVPAHPMRGAGPQGFRRRRAAPRALDGLDRVSQHRRAAARPGGDRARARSRLPPRGRSRRACACSSRRSSSSTSCRSTRTWTARLTDLKERLESATAVASVVRRRASGSELVRTRPGSLGEEVARVAARAARRARRRRRAGRVAARLPSRVPARGPPARPRRAVPRDDRDRPRRGSDRGARNTVPPWHDGVARPSELERVLGANALFATAYGNVGSSIYYALGLVTAFFALGLTPVVFIIAGLIFAATAATYAEGTVRYPEAGGSSSFARHAFNELVSFGAAWAQMLNYVITIAISAFFVPHYLSIFWAPLRQNPWDIVGGVVVIGVLVALNIVGIQESAKINVVLAAVDFATQLLLVLLGFVLVFSPHILVSNIHLGVAPTWANFLLAIPIAMIAYTGHRDRLEPVGGGARPAADRARARSVWSRSPSSRSTSRCRWVALSAMPVVHTACTGTTDRARAHAEADPHGQHGFQNDPVLGARRTTSGSLGDVTTRCVKIYVGHPRRDDPLHRDERRRDRRLADHVRDGRLPAAAARLPPAPPEVQDAVAVARRLRRRRLDPLLLPGKTTFLGAMYSFGAMLSFTVAHASVIQLRLKQRDRDEDAVQAEARTCGSAGSTGRSSPIDRRPRHGALVARRS